MWQYRWVVSQVENQEQTKLWCPAASKMNGIPHFLDSFTPRLSQQTKIISPSTTPLSNGPTPGQSSTLQGRGLMHHDKAGACRDFRFISCIKPRVGGVGGFQSRVGSESVFKGGARRQVHEGFRWWEARALL